MSTTGPLPAASADEASSHRRALGARAMFSIPFASTMSDGDVANLVKTLNLDMHLHPKLPDSPASAGVARLDFDSGLFLVRGATAGAWALEGRTWGDPLPQTVDEWHLRAAAAAHRLDPTVAFPARSPIAR